MNKNSYFGNKNSNWKGNAKNITSRALHYRITAKRGKASDHMCAFCHKNRAMDWVDVGHGKFKAGCRSCHNKYDKKIRNIQKHDPRYKGLKEELINIAINKKELN